jgi:membrane-associated phospholipid phosphatase
MRWIIIRSTAIVLLSICAAVAHAGGGPLGIDSRLGYDDSGVWKRKNQVILFDGLIAAVGLGALWEGGENRLGRTFWQSIDSTALGGASAIVLKLAFQRVRPADTNNPNEWFKGTHNASFPSGEVTVVSSIVTPFVLEYGHDYPAIYALELLPVYDGIARMKVWGHWQTDVLAGFAIGTLAGKLAHDRHSPFFLSVLPDGFSVGFRQRF